MPAGLRRSAVAVPFALSAALIASHADAQVNAEKLRKLIKNDGAAGELAASFTADFGNVEGNTSSLTAQIHGKDGPHSGFVYTKGEYTVANHIESAADSFAHLRYAYQAASFLWGEGFGQIQNDRFRRLRLRELLGIGPRFGLYQSDDFDLFTGIAVMWQHELIDVAPGAPDSPSTTYYRYSGYLAINWVLSPTVNLSSTTYVQPRVDELHDVRVLEEGSLSVDLSKRVSAKLEATIRYDSRPPTAVLAADAEVKNVIAVRF